MLLLQMRELKAFAKLLRCRTTVEKERETWIVVEVVEMEGTTVNSPDEFN